MHCSWAGVYCCTNQSLQGCAVEGGVYVLALGGFGVAGQIPDGALAPLQPSLQILSAEGKAVFHAVQVTDMPHVLAGWGRCHFSKRATERAPLI